jgi:putative transposase
MITRKAFLYRLYPNKIQTVKLDGLLNIARELYNASLQERRDAYKMQGKSLNYYDQAKELKELRLVIPEVTQLNYGASQGILRRLDKAFQAFFRRLKQGEKPGYPRFKGRNRFNSITFPSYQNKDGVHIKGNRLQIQNVGLLKIRMHRSLEGQIKTVTIKRDCGKWYAVFSNTVEIEQLPYSDKQVGIDVGIESFAVTSDGEFIENPHYLKISQRRLRVSQRKVSRRKKGSHNRRKAVKLLAKQHLKIRNQRKDFAHKVSQKIVDTYGFIAVEDLHINNMVRNHHLAQSINDAGWGDFLSLLSYKAEWAGRELAKVKPHGTSQMCSVCGLKVPKDLSVRIHHCPNCGISLHRDFNAALNILALGRSVWDVTCDSSQCVSQEAVSFS